MSAVAQTDATDGQGPDRRGGRIGGAAPENSDRLLSVVEAARCLGIGRTLMYDLLGSGQIRSLRVGRLRRIRASALTEYVSFHEGTGLFG